jgi:hypothetical protein
MKKMKEILIFLINLKNSDIFFKLFYEIDLKKERRIITSIFKL